VPKLWRSLLGRDTVTRYSIDQYATDYAFTFNGYPYAIGPSSSATQKTEDIENSFVSYVQTLYKQSGVVYAVMAARRLLFRQARICWQEFDSGEERGLFYTPELEIFRKPWPNGTTGELLSRMDQDTSLGGNFYAVREGDRLRRLRPDWVTIVLTAPASEAVRSDVAGYWFHPGRAYTMATEPAPVDEFYTPDEVCHWSPEPDPDAQYRGMSWLTPVVREIVADKAATQHKGNFFANGATLGPVFSAKEPLTEDQFNQWKTNMLDAHAGVDTAYRPLFLASPVDVTTRSVDLRQMDFKTTQGHGETRVCAAGRVPPIIVGVSEGLEAATYSNYGQARRAFGDAWAHPQWEDAVSALETLVTPPSRRWYSQARLWYSTKHVAFLREDMKDAAEIGMTKMTTITGYVREGFTPESAIASVDADDRTLLVHTGLVSVQLQPPGAGVPTDPGANPGETPASGDEAPVEQPQNLDETASTAARAGHDDEELHHYWTRDPEGLGKWVKSDHPWTSLVEHLTPHVGPERAKTYASRWFIEVFGFAAGSDLNRVTHGHPPRGHRVGPG
jgi:phage portal protein BeeE